MAAMKKSTVLWVCAGVVVLVVVVVFVKLNNRVRQLAESQNRLANTCADLFRSFAAKPVEVAALPQGNAPKGLAGYAQLPPEPLPLAPA